MLTSIVYSYILLFFMTKVSGQFNDCPCISPGSEFAIGINLLYYKCDNELSERISYNITAPEDMLSVLDSSKRTIFYIFGFKLYPDHPLTEYMMKALCTGKTDNVVLLDWSKYSNDSYDTVFQNAQKVGVLFAESICKLKNCGCDVSKIYCIGFSIGAHIAGIAGKCNKDFKIHRITGLDPANRYIPTSSLSGCYLTPDAAKCVDVIHTDMNLYGTPSYPRTGIVEFFANGGHRPQPNCTLFGMPLSPEDFCSHRRSVLLYATTKRNPDKISAYKCNLFCYIFNLRDRRIQIRIGYAFDEDKCNVREDYYFTAGVEPDYF